MSPRDPSSPNRSCQEPISIVKKYKQFADISQRVFTYTKVINENWDDLNINLTTYTLI